MEPIVVAIAKSKSEINKAVTIKELARTLAVQHNMTMVQGQKVLEDTVSLITRHLKNGERVKIAGLGMLQVRDRAARIGRNPATGQLMQIKASKNVAFRATKQLKMAI